MSECRCAEPSRRSYASVRDGIRSKAILVDPVAVAVDHDRWRTLLRCACGRLWMEACWTSGHMDVHYIYPAPPDAAEADDPMRWLRERGEELPWDGSGPLN